MTEGIGKKFWGPPIWQTIHILASTLRPENASAFKQFLESLTKLLPCDTCKDNLKRKLSAIPPEAYLSNNHDAFFYTYMLHDMVNEQINKTSIKNTEIKVSPNFDEIKSYYFNNLDQECKECSLK